MIYLATISMGTGAYALFVVCNESRLFAGAMSAIAAFVGMHAFI